MNFYNPMNAYQIQGGMGMQYPQAAPQQKMPNLQNILTPQEMNELKQDVFSVQIKEEDLLRNKCTHKRNNGFTINPDYTRDGDYMKCSICGNSFKIIDGPINVIAEKIEDVTNIIETIKTLGVELPAAFLAEISKMETVLQLLPRVHNITLKTWFEKYDRTANINNQNVGNNASQLFNYITSGGNTFGAPNPIMNNNYYAPGQQPQGGYPQMQYQQPGYPQQQMGGMQQQPMNQYQPPMEQYQQMGMQQPMNQYQPPVNNVAQNGNPFVMGGGVQQPAYGQPPVGVQQAPQQQAQQNQQTASQGQPAPTYQPPKSDGADKAVASKTMNA